MGKLSFKDKLTLYMGAGTPIIYVDTLEDDVYEQEIIQVAESAEPRLKVIEWSEAGFLENPSGKNYKPYSLKDLLDGYLKGVSCENKILVVKDVQYLLDKPEVISRLKKLAQLGKIDKENGGIDYFYIIFLAPICKIPEELEQYIKIIDIDPLSDSEIMDLIKKNADIFDAPPIPDELMATLLNLLKGFNRTEIENILYLILADDQAITMEDIPTVREQKEQILKKSGLLELKNTINKKTGKPKSLDDVGGLQNLKKWLINKADVFKRINAASKFGVAVPKGVLIAGMPGCGKSLTAEAAAFAFECPLLRLDMGRLMGKYVGESENNLRKAIKLAEAMAPCILWIDELEKAFAGSKDGGSEVTTRMTGQFLTWMQDKEDCMVFVVATANKINGLPPELLRKGRFDEIFYVDLPNHEEREKIFEIHIKKRRAQDFKTIDIGALADESEDYVGADRESVLKDGIEMAFLEDKERLTTLDILKAMRNTHPLGETMKTELEEMRKAYKEKSFTSASKGGN